MAFHARVAAERAHRLLRQFPALSILGARQVGKSTLARLAFPKFRFIDLENPNDLERAARDPLFLLSQQQHLVIGGGRRLPELVGVMRAVLAAVPRRRIVLLGWAPPGLVATTSESLTGRISLVELGGISAFEADAARLWLRGG